MILAPSILSADFSRLAEEIKRIETAGADVFHLDVMDGHFVPNMTIGPPVVASIRKCCRAMLDVHLMVEHPERLLDDFILAGADWISVHVEADMHLTLSDYGVRKRKHADFDVEQAREIYESTVKPAAQDLGPGRTDVDNRPVARPSTRAILSR